MVEVDGSAAGERRRTAAGRPGRADQDTGHRGRARDALLLRHRARAASLWLLAGLFALVVVVVARWRGLMALVGLGFAAVVFGLFIVPALLVGESPVPVAVVGAVAIMYVVLYTTHGFSIRTSAALAGTLGGIALTAALGSLGGGLRRTSLASPTSRAACSRRTPAGSTSSPCSSRPSIIAGLGVLNDVTITQASAVWELRGAAPSMTRRSLFTSAMRIGRDHVASTIYTIVFAYAGTSLLLLLVVSPLRPAAARPRRHRRDRDRDRPLADQQHRARPRDAAHHGDRRGDGGPRPYAQRSRYDSLTPCTTSGSTWPGGSTDPPGWRCWTRPGGSSILTAVRTDDEIVECLAPFVDGPVPGRDRRPARRHQPHRLPAGGAGAEQGLPQVRGGRAPVQHRQAGVRRTAPAAPGSASSCGLDLDPRLAAGAPRARGLPAPRDDRAVRPRADPEVQAEAGPRPRAPAARAAHPDGPRRAARRDRRRTRRCLGGAARLGRRRGPQERPPGGRGPGRRRGVRVRRAVRGPVARADHALRRPGHRLHRHSVAGDRRRGGGGPDVRRRPRRARGRRPPRGRRWSSGSSTRPASTT